MNQIEADLVVKWYLDLEERLKHYLRIVPIYWNHNAVLPLLGGIIIEAAGLVDSIFRKEYNVSGSRPKKNINITHFSTHYEQRYSLSKKSSLIYQNPPILLYPYQDWNLRERNNLSEFKWWDAYNKLKHERIESYHECTLNNAVKALCALHQVLAVLPCFFKALIANDMIVLGDYAIPYAIESVIERGELDISFLVESKLFATPFGQTYFPESINDIRSMHYSGSKRLSQFLGK